MVRKHLHTSYVLSVMVLADAAMSPTRGVADDGRHVVASGIL